MTRPHPADTAAAVSEGSSKRLATMLMVLSILSQNAIAKDAK